MGSSNSSCARIDENDQIFTGDILPTTILEVKPQKPEICQFCKKQLNCPEFEETFAILISLLVKYSLPEDKSNEFKQNLFDEKICTLCAFFQWILSPRTSHVEVINYTCRYCNQTYCGDSDEYHVESDICFFCFNDLSNRNKSCDQYATHKHNQTGKSIPMQHQGYNCCKKM
jgi:hypothetical protein